VIYATPETEHRERTVHFIGTDEEIGIIVRETEEYAFYAHDTTPLTYDLLLSIANFLRTLNPA
jgi:hypothetical protein